MLCPGCGSEYLSGDKFCTVCGLDLTAAGKTCPACGAEVIESDLFCTKCGGRIEKDTGTTRKLPAQAREKTEWTSEQVMNMAAGLEYTVLSPLSAFHIKGKKGETVTVDLDRELLDVLLRPERAVHVTGMSKDRSFQKILFIRDFLCYQWLDEGGRVVISREENPRKFFEGLYNEIGNRITIDQQDMTVLAQGEMEVLKGITAFCESLELIHVTPAFATEVQIRRFLNTGDELELERPLKGLSEKGLIKLLGRENPVIKLEEKGKEIAKALTDYDFFYNLIILTEGEDEFPSLNFSSRGRKLYMLTKPNNGQDIVIRTLDLVGFRSLLNWAWTSGISVKDESVNHSDPHP